MNIPHQINNNILPMISALHQTMLEQNHLPPQALQLIERLEKVMSDQTIKPDSDDLDAWLNEWAMHGSDGSE